MNNDSTATSFAAFGTGCVEGFFPTRSCPQPAGIASYANSGPLAAIPGLVAAGFSDPAMMNNIVLGNRSQYWEVLLDPALGFDIGRLVIETGVSDFAVVPAAAGTLTTINSVITTGNGAAGDVLGGSNVEVDGTIEPTVGTVPCPDRLTGECTIVENPYRNGPPSFVTVQPDGTVLSANEFPAVVAAALDEGGNFIDVHFGPLSPVGDYHLQTDATNPAINTGAAPSAAVFPNRSPDIEGDARPQGADLASAMFDIGADEVPDAVTGTGGNQAPQIVTPLDGNNSNNFTAFIGVPFGLQVVAIDPNDDNLVYSLCRGANNCTEANLPAGMTINSVSGLIDWPDPEPTASGNRNLRNFQVTVSDGVATDTHTFRIRVRNANAPIANNDAFNVNTGGQFTVAAPGVLQNDNRRNENRFGVVVAQLADKLPAEAGNVALTAEGGFTYTPAPSFIGNTTFTYRAVNNVGPSEDATVTLRRRIALTDARYIADAGFHLTGFAESLALLEIYLDPPGGGNSNRTLIAFVTASPVDGSWSFDGDAAPQIIPGPDDVIDIIRANGPGRINNAPLFSVSSSSAPLSSAFVQCPGDTDGDAIIDIEDPTRQIKCVHLGAGDGFARMADGRELYGFSFSDLTGVPANVAIDRGILDAQFPAPTLVFNENDEVYLTLTNVGMLIRPDLFDPHTVHFHGFPNASSTFDGVPESSISINGGFSLTYYYNVVEPGTFMYHCHVEAAEHMQMGMLGNLYVHPAQNGQVFGGYDTFVYNDEDGSTGYDVEVPIQIGSFDAAFHDASLLVQPLPFADMHDDYQLLNGRGYPDTTLDGPLPVVPGGDKESAGVTSSNTSSQVVNTVVTATVGDKILLRISNLNVTQYYTLATTGLTMQVVGTGAHILRGPGGTDLYYETSSVTLGGGEAVDVLIDTTGVAPGTYLLYSTNLNELSNGTEDFGGMMTEIVIN
jgi:hypothetical protein